MLSRQACGASDPVPDWRGPCPAEQSYRDNANDPQQDAEYRKFRELLEADPEWHDGSIDSFRTG